MFAVLTKHSGHETFLVYCIGYNGILDISRITALDTQIIAKETYKLIDITPNLNLIGVVPKKLDRKVTNLWQSITIFESLTVSDNLKMDRDQIMIVNSLPEATDYIEKKS